MVLIKANEVEVIFQQLQTLNPDEPIYKTAVNLMRFAKDFYSFDLITCKDCKHREEEFFPNGGFKGYVCRNPYGIELSQYLEDDDFCSYAERRDAYNGET